MVLMVSDILWNGINIIKNTVVNVKVIFIERSVDTLQNYQNLLGDIMQLDNIDHVAIQVTHIARGVAFYKKNFNCEVEYEDQSWALLKFENTKLALVLPAEHPPHIAIIDDELEGGDVHRDGSRSKYEHDGYGNMIEIITYKDIK